MKKVLSSIVINSLLCALVGLALAAQPVRTASAHTFHTSLMQMEYNARSRCVEIAVQVFTHDLENVLTRRRGGRGRVRLDKTPDAAKLALAYLNEAFTLRNRQGEVKTFKWVGMEQSAEAVWLYVEAAMPEGLAGASVRNRIFFDLLDDQVNRVHVKFDGRKTDLVFKPGDDFKPITVKAS